MVELVVCLLLLLQSLVELEQVKKGWLVNEIVKEIISSSGITTKLPSGKMITSTQRSQAVTNLYLAMTDAAADASSIIELAEQMAKQVPKYGRGIAQEAAGAAMKKYSETYLNLQKMQANALLRLLWLDKLLIWLIRGSKAFGKANIEQLQDEMMDRLKALLILKEIDNMDTAAALGDQNIFPALADAW